jgi:hypothetical protein
MSIDNWYDCSLDSLLDSPQFKRIGRWMFLICLLVGCYIFWWAEVDFQSSNWPQRILFGIIFPGGPILAGSAVVSVFFLTY